MAVNESHGVVIAYFGSDQTLVHDPSSRCSGSTTAMKSDNWRLFPSLEFAAAHMGSRFDPCQNCFHDEIQQGVSTMTLEERVGIIENILRTSRQELAIINSHSINDATSLSRSLGAILGALRDLPGSD